MDLDQFETEEAAGERVVRFLAEEFSEGILEERITEATSKEFGQVQLEGEVVAGAWVQKVQRYEGTSGDVGGRIFLVLFPQEVAWYVVGVFYRIGHEPSTQVLSTPPSDD